MSRAALAALAAVLALAGCKEHEFHPPDEEERVASVSATYRAENFDTITWPDSAARLIAGNDVFAAHCRKCHGVDGRAGTAYAASRDLEVPSLVRADWPYATAEAVRERVFVGHPEGMPSWGLGRLSSRDIDAAAWYVQHGLREQAD